MSKISEAYDNPDITSNANDVPPEQEEHEKMVADQMNELSKLAKKYLWAIQWQNGGATDISLVISENEPTEHMAKEVVAYEVNEPMKWIKELEERGDFRIESIYKIYPTMYDEVESDNEPFQGNTNQQIV